MIEVGFAQSLRKLSDEVTERRINDEYSLFLRCIRQSLQAVAEDGGSALTYSFKYSINANKAVQYLNDAGLPTTLLSGKGHISINIKF